MKENLNAIGEVFVNSVIDIFPIGSKFEPKIDTESRDVYICEVCWEEAGKKASKKILISAQALDDYKDNPCKQQTMQELFRSKILAFYKSRNDVIGEEWLVTSEVLNPYIKYNTKTTTF